MTSRNLVFPGKQQAELVEEPVAEPAAGELLIESLVSHISTGTESFCYRGVFDADTGWARWVDYPFYPGYSNVGRVAAVGAEVSGFAVGDRVHTGGNHRQRFCIGAGQRVIRLPETAGDEDAAWSALAVITQGAIRRAEHALGERAVVIGLGPLGQLVTQYLRLSGLHTILVVDTVQSRIDLALAHGATASFCGFAADAAAVVLDHTEGEGADVVFDVTGHYAVFPLALGLARRWGKVVLLGDTPHPSRQHLTHDVHGKQLTVVGTKNELLPPAMAQWTRRRQIELFLEYVRRGQMQVADLVTDRIRPDDAPAMYARLQERRDETVGILIDWR